MLAKSKEVEQGFIPIVRFLSDDVKNGKHRVSRYLGDLIKPTKKFVKKSIPPSFQSFKQNSYFRKRENVADECAPSNKSMATTLNATFIEDPISPEGQEMIEVPIKEIAEDVHLSDQAFEQAGDTVADTFDFCNAKIYKGKEADEKMAEIKEQAKSTAAPATERH